VNVRINKEDKRPIETNHDLYEIMLKILLRQNRIRRKQEYFWMVGLQDGDWTLEFIELIAIGGENFVNIEHRQIFRVAVIKDIKHLMLVHNHPGGTLHASESDVEITDKLRKSGDLLGINVWDHLVITEEGWVSVVSGKQG